MRFIERVSRERGIDLEAWESCLRRIVLRAGANVLEDLLQNVGCGRRPEPVDCSCGTAMQSVGLREKRVRTILGTVRFRRSLYVCPDCGKSRLPGDELLEVVGTGYSPGLRRMMARAGSRTSFAEAEEDLREYAGIEIGRKEVERVAEAVGKQIETWSMEELYQSTDDEDQTIPVLYVSFDGTGVPIQRRELKGRRGKQPDGTAKTREVKLGCIFTQTSTDKENNPIRDPDSTTYTGAIETSEKFGWRIYHEARIRGLHRARRVVILTDGANYNKTIGQTHFPHALHIIDLYHAREKLCELAKLLVAESKKESQLEGWLELLDQGAIERLLAAIRKYLPPSGKRRKEALTTIGYFQENAEAMRYQKFQSQGFFIGSGVVEAGCRTIIAQRLKKSGMFWSVAGANAIIASRCCQLSRRFEDFWEDAAA